MKTVEVLTEVENMLTDLKLMDLWGEPIVGLEVIGIINQYDSERLKKLEDNLQTGALTLLQYRDGMKELITDFKSHLFRNKIFKELFNLELDQQELDLIK